jgi:FimV-like protein
MGDIEGARSLIEEVEAESSGQLRQEAQRMLGLLG